MDDQRESDERQRKPREARPDGIGSPDGNPEGSKPGKRVSFASDGKIKAVSAMLFAKKDKWSRSQSSTPISLPEMPGSPGRIARHLDSISSPRAAIDAQSTSLEPPPLKLPDVGANRAEDSSAEQPPVEPIGGSDVSHPVGSSRPQRSDGSHVLPTLEPSPNLIGMTERDLAASGHALDSKPTESTAGPVQPSILSGRIEPIEPRLTAHVSQFLEEDAPDGPARQVSNRSSSGTDSGRDFMSKSDEFRTGDEDSPRNHPTPSVSSRLASVDLPREPERSSFQNEQTRNVEDQELEPKSFRSGLGVNPGNDLARSSEPARPFVRNPLSSEMRNFSMADSMPQENSDITSGRERGPVSSDSDEEAFGAPTASQGGPSVDLSKTNELLQQLIDAVRRQRPSALPVGGPSVYPDR